MASGHANRANRPNTWLHRPAMRRDVLTCQLGAVHTWHLADYSSRLAEGLLSAVKQTLFHAVPNSGREWSLRGGFATVNNYRLPGEEGRFASEK
jgi:hypothetical protein